MTHDVKEKLWQFVEDPAFVALVCDSGPGDTEIFFADYRVTPNSVDFVEADNLGECLDRVLRKIAENRGTL